MHVPYWGVAGQRKTVGQSDTAREELRIGSPSIAGFGSGQPLDISATVAAVVQRRPQNQSFRRQLPSIRTDIREEYQQLPQLNLSEEIRQRLPEDDRIDLQEYQGAEIVVMQHADQRDLLYLVLVKDGQHLLALPPEAAVVRRGDAPPRIETEYPRGATVRFASSDPVYLIAFPEPASGIVATLVLTLDVNAGIRVGVGGTVSVGSVQAVYGFADPQETPGNAFYEFTRDLLISRTLSNVRRDGSDMRSWCAGIARGVRSVSGRQPLTALLAQYGLGSDPAYRSLVPTRIIAGNNDLATFTAVTLFASAFTSSPRGVLALFRYQPAQQAVGPQPQEQGATRPYDPRPFQEDANLLALLPVLPGQAAPTYSSETDQDEDQETPWDRALRNAADYPLLPGQVTFELSADPLSRRVTLQQPEGRSTPPLSLVQYAAFREPRKTRRMRGPYWEREPGSPHVWVDEELAPGQELTYTLAATYLGNRRTKYCSINEPSVRDERRSIVQDCVIRTFRTRPSAIRDVTFEPQGNEVVLRWEGGDQADRVVIIPNINREPAPPVNVFPNTGLTQREARVYLRPGDVLDSVVLTARNEAGVSDPAEVAIGFEVAPGTPGPITGRVALPGGASKDVLLLWEAAPGAQFYEVRRRMDDGSWPPPERTTTARYLDTTTEWDTPYTYQVRSVSSTGQRSPWSGSTTVRVPLAHPQSPAGLRVVVDGSNLRVQWLAQPDARQYRVSLSSSAQDTIYEELLDRPATRWVIPLAWGEGLRRLRGRVGVVRVTAINETGAATATTRVSGPVTVYASGQPDIDPRRPGEPVARGRAFVKWPVEDPADEYVVERIPYGRTEGDVIGRVGGGFPGWVQFTDRDVPPASAFQYQVRGVVDGVRGWPSTGALVLESPAAVPSGLAVEVADDGLMVQWTEPVTGFVRIRVGVGRFMDFSHSVQRPAAAKGLFIPYRADWVRRWAQQGQIRFRIAASAAGSEPSFYTDEPLWSYEEDVETHFEGPPPAAAMQAVVDTSPLLPDRAQPRPQSAAPLRTPPPSPPPATAQEPPSSIESGSGAGVALLAAAAGMVWLLSSKR